MKFARYSAHGDIAYGVVDGEVLRQITNNPFEAYEITDHTHTLDQVWLLPPVEPRKVMAIALNYGSHLARHAAPKQPEPFWKNPSSVIGPDESIVIPPDAGKVDAEGELVVVIGKKAKRVSKETALDHVLGYTCGNDVSARPWQSNDIQWWRGKGSDTFAPLGPYLVTDLDPTKLEVCTRVNGEEKQGSGVDKLLFDIPTLISFITQAVTLDPGDVIYTGTPGIPPELHPGDVVEVEVPGIGVLRNKVTA